MKAFLQNLFAYHHHFNLLLCEQLQTQEELLPQRTVPLFCHCLNAHQIWNARILGNETRGVHEVHPLELCNALDQENYEHSLRILEERTLDERIAYTNSKGMTYDNSILDILFHVCNHFTHHKGQIISDIRQSGAEPIVTDYIFYKRG